MLIHHNQRGFAHILLFLLLIVGLAVGLYLVQQTQIFRSKADANPPVTFQTINGKSLTTSGELPLSRYLTVGVVLSAPAYSPPPRPSTPPDQSHGKLFQIVLDQGGQSYERSCEAIPVKPGGVDWERCGGWRRIDVLQSGQSVDNFVLQEEQGRVNYQTVLDRDGRTAYQRKCPVQQQSIFGLPPCGPSNPINLDEIRSSGEKYRNLSHYLIPEGDQKTLYQSLVAENGQDSYVRRCPIITTTYLETIHWAGCGNWQSVDLRDLRGIGNERYHSLSAFVIRDQDRDVLYQSLLDANGQMGYGRRCPLDSSRAGGVNWEGCTPWTDVPFSNLRGEGGERYLSVSSYFVDNTIITAPVGSPILPTAVRFRLAESSEGLANALEQNYADNIFTTYTFIQHTDPGPKTLFVRFIYKTALGEVYQDVQASFKYQPWTYQGAWDMPVLVLKYFPLTADGSRIDKNITGDVDAPYREVRQKTVDITNRLPVAIEEASRYLGYKNPDAEPSLRYRIVDTKEFTRAVPIAPKPDIPTYPDYSGLLTENNICDYVDNKGVKEVWIWAYQGPNKPDTGQPYLAIVESKMSGPRVYHGFRDIPICKNTYIVYTFNYNRGTAETFHSWGHELEWELDHFDQKLFALFKGPTHPLKMGLNGRCGWVHNPPNARFEYDWKNTQQNSSDCEDWNPDSIGRLTQVSCQLWGCKDVNDTNNSQLNYFIWLWQHMPGEDNNVTYQGRPLRNWWEIRGNFDGALQSRRLTQ